MRLTIATSKSCISLGINGAMSFYKAMYANDLAAIQQRIVVTIDADFVENLQRMETYPFGFMEASKIELLKMCTDELGKKCIITSDWISKSNQTRAQWYMDTVKLINEGFSLEDTQAKINYRNNEP